MIAYIEGTLVHAQEQQCIILTSGGVGYRITCPANTALCSIGEKMALFTYTSVREDAIELFGFETFAERQTFEILKGISKIGPRTALAILSCFKPDELQNIVAQENLNELKKVNGIGVKTAQHILLELRYKLKAAPLSANRLKISAPAGIYSDVVAALINLGYRDEECAPVVREILAEEEDLDLGSAIRKALKELAKGKQA